jgi:hypothetical protein
MDKQLILGKNHFTTQSNFEEIYVTTFIDTSIG